MRSNEHVNSEHINNSEWGALGKEVEFVGNGFRRNLNGGGNDNERFVGGGEEIDGNVKRQQDKVIAGFLWNGGAVPNEDFVEVNDEQRGQFLEMRRGGIVTDKDESRMLQWIVSPVDRMGVERVFGRNIDGNIHAERILSMATRDSFDYETARVGDLGDFLEKYPTPMEFEGFRDDFLGRIKELNSDKKYQQYVQDMEEFQKNIYGKRYEYYLRMKELNEEAKRYSRDDSRGGFREDYGAFRRSTGSDSRFAQETVGGVSRRITGEDESNILRKFGETVIAKEGLGACMVAKAVTRGGEIENSVEASEDAIFVDDKEGVFAVFDGAGGVANGKLASRVAAKKMEELVAGYEVDGVNFLGYAMRQMNEEVAEKADGGIATAVVGVIKDKGEGKKELTLASMGDSRLYIVRGEKAYLMTKDEGFENRIFNALGMGGELKQMGTVELRKGDRIVLCSDGITGDRGSDLMSEEELYRIVSGGFNGPESSGSAGGSGSFGWKISATEAAEALVKRARKKDDRTVVVKDIV